MNILQSILAPIVRPLGFVPANAPQNQKTLTGSTSVRHLPVPPSVLTDSYKATHPFIYPEAKKMTAYGEFRAPFNKDSKDARIVVYGIRYLIENYVAVQWTEADVEAADKFYSQHNAGFSAYPWPKDLFLKFIRENNGYIPVKIQALPEGTVVYPHTPVFQITAENEYSRLVTFLETLLTMIWYPTTVATLSRRAKHVISAAFEKSVDDDAMFLLNSRLHDFGFRGCTCLEQSIIGGTAHLLNFEGTDTMSAAYHAQFDLNGGKPVGTSIPATEHSVMTAFPTEHDALESMMQKFGTGVYAAVMDTYDYEVALKKVIPGLAELKKSQGGFFVIRPDSGNPVDVVLLGLREAEKTFGSTTNKKGFRVLNNVGVIQGDGINLDTIGDILKTVLEAGFSAQNVAFGMGAGLLQKINRDTMSFATKLSHITYADGTARDTMKSPKTDPNKRSLPGSFNVYRVNGVPTVFPHTVTKEGENLLQTVYNKGPVHVKWPVFADLKTKVEAEWKALPPTGNAISSELSALMDEVSTVQAKRNAQ